MQTKHNQITPNEGENSPGAELKRLLGEILESAAELRAFFLTDEEEKEKREAILLYDEKIQEMLVGTRLHLELYRAFGWKELVYGEDDI